MLGLDFWRWLGACTQLQIAVTKLAAERELLPIDCGCATVTVPNTFNPSKGVRHVYAQPSDPSLP